MKKVALVIISSIYINVFCQDQMKIENLDLPATPAVSLLDGNISTIATPNNIRAFGLSVLNSFQTNNGIPSSYAMEFNPYWFIRKRDVGIKTYFEYNGKPFSGITRNSSVSMAFIKKDSVQNASIGIKVNVFKIYNRNEYKESGDLLNTSVDDYDNYLRENHGYFVDKVKNIKTKLQHKLDSLKGKSDKMVIAKECKEIYDILQANSSYIEESDVPEMVDDLLKYAEGNSFNASDFENKVKDLIERIVFLNFNIKIFNDEASKSSLLATLKSNVDSIQNLKPVFSIDLASAYNHFFDNSAYSSGKFGKVGIWATLTFNQSLSKNNKNYLNIYLFNRFIRDEMQYDDTLHTYKKNSFTDIGGKIGFEFNKLSIAYEYIKRTGDGADYRSVGSVNYKLSKDVTIEGGFGKNFQDTDNLITILGLRWGLNFNNEFSTKN